MTIVVFASEAMQLNDPDAITELLFSAASQGRLFDGELLPTRSSPRSDSGASESGWRITSRVPSEFLEAVQRLKPETVITSDVLGISSSLSHWVIAYRAGAWQHRFLLPLAGPAVQELVQDLAEAELTLDFQTGNGERAYSARVPVSAHLRRALVRAIPSSIDIDRVLQETLVVTAKLLDPRALPPVAAAAAPTAVSVTGVLPAGLVANAAYATKRPNV